MNRENDILNQDKSPYNEDSASQNYKEKQVAQFDVEQQNTEESNTSQTSVEGASVYNATINICKSGFGTTILFMPFLFKKCGIILSIIIMSFTGLLCYYAWMQLIKVIQRLEEKEKNTRKVTLTVVIEAILGYKLKLVSEIFTFGFNFGTILSYMVFIQTSMKDILENKIALCIIMGLIYVPVSLYKNIEKLGVFSQFGLTTFFTVVFVIIGKSLYLIFSDQNTSTNEDFQFNLFSFQELPLFFGVFVFAYDINGVITDVYASMKEKQKFDTILSRQLILQFGFQYIVVMCLTGLITGSISYFAFKDQTSDMIFQNLSDMGITYKVLKIFYAFSLFGSILLYGFPLLKKMDNFMERMYFSQQLIQGAVMRTFFFLSIFILATLLPRITDIFNLLGCFFSIALGFVFPILLSEKVSENEKNNTSKITNYVVLFIGLIGGISGIVSTIIDLS